jgi:GNAT superfamily N-acetyltransferase
MVIKTNLDGFYIKYAEEADAPKILYYIKELAKFENELEYVKADEKTLHDSLFIRKAAEVIFGMYNDENIGFAVFHQNFSTFLGKPGINLVDLYIEPAMRDKGFGNEMLSYLAKLTIERNCGRLEWWVHDWNVEAKRFYNRIGSKEVEKIRVYRLAEKELMDYGESFQSL